MASGIVVGDWQISDRAEFRYGVDKGESSREHPSPVFLKSVVPRPKDFGFICKTVDAATYVGKRLKFTASIKTELPEGASAQLWLRVDGDWKQRAECFDNMYKDRVKGVTSWCTFSVKALVPEGASKIVYGVLLNGTGQVWIDDLKLEGVL